MRLQLLLRVVMLARRQLTLLCAMGDSDLCLFDCTKHVLSMRQVKKKENEAADVGEGAVAIGCRRARAPDALPWYDRAIGPYGFIRLDHHRYSLGAHCNKPRRGVCRANKQLHIAPIGRRLWRDRWRRVMETR